MIRGVFEPVRTAILGLGRMGSLHARLAEAQGIRLTALMDPRPGLPKQIAEELGLEATLHDEVRSVLGTPELEACVVATPTSSHADIVNLAMKHGLHVLCEKPLTLDPDDDLRLGEVAESFDLILQVGFWRRFSPPWTAARETLLSGKIGRPLFYRGAQWDEGLPPPQFHDLSLSGGLIVDCGVHDFDLMEWMIGEPVVEVTAHALPLAHPELKSMGDIDNAVIVLQLESGAVGVVDLSRNARFGDDMRTEILGSEGALFVEAIPHGCAKLGDREGIRTIEGSTVTDPFQNGVAGELAAFAAAIRGQTVEFPRAPDSERALRVALAARQSVELGTAVNPR
jgi:scyllo-inositol 2-dehydrogenase (NAD+)